LQLVPQVQTTQLAPQIQSLQLVPQVQTTQLAPQVQTVQFTPQVQLQVAPQTQSLQFVAQVQSLQGAQQNGGTPSVATGTGEPTDYDYQVLTTGFGGSTTKLRNFEGILRNKARELLANRRGLSEQELTTLILDFAKSSLSSSGFGFLIDAAIEPILKRLVGKVFQEHQAAPPNQPANQNVPSQPIPAGGATFDITGRITLTPASSGGQQGQGQQGQQGQGQQGQQGQGQQGQGQQGQQGGIPQDLTPEGGAIAPPPPQ